MPSINFSLFFLFVDQSYIYITVYLISIIILERHQMKSKQKRKRTIICLVSYRNDLIINLTVKVIGQKKHQTQVNFPRFFFLSSVFLTRQWLDFYVIYKIILLFYHVNQKSLTLHFLSTAQNVIRLLMKKIFYVKRTRQLIN